MRLAPSEVAAIVEEVLRLDSKARVYLHGSRVRDDLKGGDIDLIVVSEQLGFSDKITLLAEIKNRIGDQKIDLRIARSHELSTDLFLASTFPAAVELKQG